MKDERNDATSISLAINDQNILRELSVGDEGEERDIDEEYQPLAPCM